MNWPEVVADPSLQDLPYKIELDEYGRIVMSPATKRHARLAYRIARLLEDHVRGGESFTEAPVETQKGVRVPDAGWASVERLEDSGEIFTRAPEICVEVVSRSNRPEEIEEKARLFLAAGAEEVWVCDLEGRLRFIGPAGPMKRSALAPDFPTRVELSP